MIVKFKKYQIQKLSNLEIVKFKIGRVKNCECSKLLMLKIVKFKNDQFWNVFNKVEW